MQGRHRPTDAEGTSRHTRWSLLLLLAAAQLMVILDISAVNVALPDLTEDLGIDRADIGWTITSYSLLFGVGAGVRDPRLRREQLRPGARARRERLVHQPDTTWLELAG